MSVTAGKKYLKDAPVQMELVHNFLCLLNHDTDFLVQYTK